MDSQPTKPTSDAPLVDYPSSFPPSIGASVKGEPLQEGTLEESDRVASEDKPSSFGLSGLSGSHALQAHDEGSSTESEDLNRIHIFSESKAKAPLPPITAQSDKSQETLDTQGQKRKRDSDPQDYGLFYYPCPVVEKAEHPFAEYTGKKKNMPLLLTSTRDKGFSDAIDLDRLRE
jgi:hypothetical protein